MENRDEKPSLYERFDGTVMKGVNAGVRAWNWTTGRTRADLANSMIYAGQIAMGYGFARDLPNTLLGVPFVAYAMINIHSLTKINKKIDTDEISALNNCAKDRKSENFRNSIKILAPILTGGSSAGLLTVSRIENRIDRDYLIGACADFLAIGLSAYVMRADYLPPRKDCVRRGLERLAKVWDETTTPLPIPQGI